MRSTSRLVVFLPLLLVVLLLPLDNAEAEPISYSWPPLGAGEATLSRGEARFVSLATGESVQIENGSGWYNFIRIRSTGYQIGLQQFLQVLGPSRGVQWAEFRIEPWQRYMIADDPTTRGGLLLQYAGPIPDATIVQLAQTTRQSQNLQQQQQRNDELERENRRLRDALDASARPEANRPQPATSNAGTHSQPGTRGPTTPSRPTGGAARDYVSIRWSNMASCNNNAALYGDEMYVENNGDRSVIATVRRSWTVSFKNYSEVREYRLLAGEKALIGCTKNCGVNFHETCHYEVTGVRYE